jgi:hypothetical protein
MHQWNKSALSLLIMFVVTGSSEAIDLAKIDRTIKKEPAYPSKPTYCLLVFGSAPSQRIWLVVAGDSVYLDRNANGDLTDTRKKFGFPHEEFGHAYLRGHRVARLGDIEMGPLKHKNLTLTQSELRPDFVPAGFLGLPLKALLPGAAGVKIYSLSLDVEMHLHSPDGVPVSGRFPMEAGLDDRGFLTFAERPGDAPVIAFTQEFQIGPYGQPVLEVGKETELPAQVGTRGLGPGTFAAIPFAAISADVHPVARIEFPRRQGGSPIAIDASLKERC